MRGILKLLPAFTLREGILEFWSAALTFELPRDVMQFSIYTLSDLGVLSNLIGSLSLANEHYSPPTE